MEMYCVVIGDNPELSKQVQEALFNAGFKWALNEGENVFLYENSPLLILEIGTITCLLSDFDKQEFTGVTKYVTADFILQGGAMKLDGAKKVDPRWFLWANSDGSSSDVAEFKGNNGAWLGFDGTNLSMCCDLSDCINKNEFTELTAEDVAYITDNAEKAKELGYVFREWKSGDDIISYNGEFRKNILILSTSFCAGYRYCKKAEVKEVTSAGSVINSCDITIEFHPPVETFCHNCGETVTPAASNYCSKCGAKLEK